MTQGQTESKKYKHSDKLLFIKITHQKMLSRQSVIIKSVKEMKKTNRQKIEANQLLFHISEAFQRNYAEIWQSRMLMLCSKRERRSIQWFLMGNSRRKMEERKMLYTKYHAGIANWATLVKHLNGTTRENHNIGDVLEIKMKIMEFSGILETQDTVLLGKMFNVWSKGPVQEN